jgi:cytochrome c biogenesis protein CcmG, thiol:disulfide interchange protein DsbE
LYYKEVNRLRSVLVIACLALFVSCYSGSTPPGINSQAPDFTIKDADKTVSLSQFRGKPLVLNFWATWCPPCVEEIPSMMRLQQQLGNRVQILAVSTDIDNAAYHRFIADKKVNFLTVRDGDQEANTMYGTFKFPETYIIDSKGVIRRKFIGRVDWDSPEIVQYLTSLQ